MPADPLFNVLGVRRDIPADTIAITTPLLLRTSDPLLLLVGVTNVGTSFIMPGDIASMSQ